MLRWEYGIHAVGPAPRSAHAPRADRAARGHRCAGLDAPGGSLRDVRRIRAHGRITRAQPRSHRDSRRREPHHRPRRARERARPLRAVPPGRARARALLTRLPAPRTDRRRRGEGRFQGWTPHTHHAKGRRTRHPPDRCTVTRRIDAGEMIRRFALSAVFVVAGFTAGLVLTGRLRSASDSRASDSRADTAQAPAASAPRPAAQASPAPQVGGPDFTRIVAQTVKGVVNISSLQVVRRTNSPFANDPFFSYFFGDQDAFGSRDRRSLSLGSGVIVSEDGYVVTNNHVVGENLRAVREVTVALADKRESHGTIIGTDPATDIALLKIDVKGLPVVPWGNSTKLQVGEWVLAIGSPFQLSQTVTAGIVSATGRANVGFAEYEDFIQTDAAINPGNSGGALINTRGELVGINTGIFSQSGGYQGIGFAIPSNLARHIVDDLRKYGEVKRGSVDFRVDNMALE